MGLPARRIEESRARKRSHLRIAKAPSAPKPRGRSADAAALAYFRIFAACVVVLAAAGLGRVGLSARAAQLSRESMMLRESIRSERYEGDMLEVRESALGSPSRIKKIASKTMGMKPANKVTYLDISPKAPAEVAVAAPTEALQPKKVARADSAGASALRTIMDLTAGEAQVLLLGDVALASGHK